jgi:8-oxo-dGTP diphosphatase
VPQPSSIWGAGPLSIRRPIPAVIAVVVSERSVLLVRRANPPDAGQWGFPGGKIEFGEPLDQAAARELFEETSVIAQPGLAFAALDAFDRGPDGSLREHYILIAVLCRWREGLPIAGDDAREAAWYDLGALDDDRLAMSFGVAAIARQAVALSAVLDELRT